jgi:uncharacterized membrane protein
MKARDFRAKAWAACKGNWGVAILSLIIVSIITGICGVIPAVGSLITLVITGPLMLGLAVVFSKLIQGEKAEIANLFDGFKNFVNSFLLYILNSLFTVLWSLLFVIPGIVMSYAYSMSFYILKDNPELSANEARKQSIEMMRGNKWRLFCLDLSFIGWVLLSILTLGILMLWVSPVQQASHAAFYESLKPAPAAAEEVAE